MVLTRGQEFTNALCFDDPNVRELDPVIDKWAAFSALLHGSVVSLMLTDE